MEDKMNHYQLFESTLQRRAYSEKTIEAYMASLRQLNSHFPSKSIEDLSLVEIKKYFDILISRKKVSVSFLYIAQSAFCLFYDDVLQKGYDLKASIKLPTRTWPALVFVSSRNESRSRLKLGSILGSKGCRSFVS